MVQVVGLFRGRVSLPWSRVLRAKLDGLDLEMQPDEREDEALEVLQQRSGSPVSAACPVPIPGLGSRSSGDRRGPWTG